MKIIGTRTGALALILVFLLAGCFSHEWPHVLESRATQLEAVKLPNGGEAQALSIGQSVVYFPVPLIGTHGISSICVGGIFPIPLEIVKKDEKELNNRGKYFTPSELTLMQIGIKPGPAPVEISFNKLRLEYLGQIYHVDQVFSGSRRIIGAEKIPAGDAIIWYVLRFPVYVDAKNQFSIVPAQYSISDHPEPLQNIQFGPKDVYHENEFGERGC